MVQVGLELLLTVIYYNLHCWVQVIHHLVYKMSEIIINAHQTSDIKVIFNRKKQQSLHS